MLLVHFHHILARKLRNGSHYMCVPRRLPADITMLSAQPRTPNIKLALRTVRTRATQNQSQIQSALKPSDNASTTSVDEQATIAGKNISQKC